MNLTSAAKSARLPPLGLIQLGICRLCKTKVEEPLREEVPSVLLMAPDVGVDGRVECFEVVEYWLVPEAGFTTGCG